MSKKSKDGTSVKEMVREFLDANGYDGLCNPDAECGCMKDDLFICGYGQAGSCVCAYEGKPPDWAGEEGYDGWLYVSENEARDGRD